mmetsp:Transcript_2931/g.3617  ORF Transcript_2931/g.3617 Transcript_2931/m.3617 type:complete len:191 (-) Transcript_2931:3-575(-)
MSDDILHLLVKGDDGVGKTSLVQAFVTKSCIVAEFDPTLEETSRAVVEIDDEPVVVDVFDSAEQEEFHSLAKIEYKAQQIQYTDGIVLVFSVTDRISFDSLAKHYQTIQTAKSCGLNTKPLKLCIVGTKTDNQEMRQVSISDAEEFAQSVSAPYFETSAKQGINCDAPFLSITKCCVSPDTSSSDLSSKN